MSIKIHKANTNRTKRRLDKCTIMSGDFHQSMPGTERLSRWKIGRI